MNDNLISWLSVFLLGIVEGLTEFLPISSTGHLIVVAHFLGEESKSIKLFEVVIQLGAILAVCWHYRKRLLDIVTTKHSLRAEPTRLVIKLFIAFLPAAVLGLLFYDYIKAYLFSVKTVAIALIIGGIIIIVVERYNIKQRFTSVESLKFSDAFAIGCFQAIALFPGASRSGSTIIGGLLWGVNRKTATEFSFLLALPTMFAAVFYDLYKNTDILNAQLIVHILVGLFISFCSALVAIKTLLHFISKYKFTIFGWYRIALGTIILILLSNTNSL